MEHNVNVSIDPELKDAATKVFDQLGITEDDAIRMLYTHVKYHKDVPFSRNIPNAETVAALEEAENEENLTTYSSFEEWEKSFWEEDAD